MAQIANARFTIGALFGAISTSANAVTQVITTGVEGVNMLDNYVKQAASNQEKRIAADSVDYEARIQEEIAQMQAARRIEVTKFRAQSELHAQLYDDAYDKIGQALADLRARKAKAIKA